MSAITVPLELFNAVLLDLSALRSHREYEALHELDRRIHEFDQCRYLKQSESTESYPGIAHDLETMRAALQEFVRIDEEDKLGLMAADGCDVVLALDAARKALASGSPSAELGRRDGHSALRVRDGKLETFDPHPEPAAITLLRRVESCLTVRASLNPDNVDALLLEIRRFLEVKQSATASAKEKP